MKVVEELFTRHAQVLRLHVGNAIIGKTAEHPFWVVGKGWVNANELTPGDTLIGKDGQTISISRVEDTGEWATVYNMRVADWHTYFVGAAEWGFSVWAHNVYEVGTYNAIKKLSELGVKEANHIPQTSQALSLIHQFGHGAVRFGHEIAISLPSSEHLLVSLAQACRRLQFGRLPASVRQLLAQDLRLLRRYTSAPNSALKQIVKQFRERYPIQLLKL